MDNAVNLRPGGPSERPSVGGSDEYQARLNYQIASERPSVGARGSSVGAL
jgi:hypothetical protein